MDKPAGDRKTCACIHEDRSSCLTGVKLTVLSLRQHYPGLPVIISCPSPPAAFVDWVDGVAGAKLVSFPAMGSVGFNVKPSLLLSLLQQGYDEVIWIDSDIILSGSLSVGLTDHGSDVLVTAEETYWGQDQGGTRRTIAWGLTPGRHMPCTVNSGIIRVTEHHAELLRAWHRMLNHPAYLRAQSLPWYDRPLHMVGDQEVLTGLLGSTGFAHVPLVMLKRGVDIAQCFGPAGFTPSERMHCLAAGFPALVHAMGPKPWDRAKGVPSIRGSDKAWVATLRDYYQYVSLELSPYMHVARQYRSDLDEDASWLEQRSRLAKTISRLTFDEPVLQGLPIAVVDACVRYARRKLGIARYTDKQEFMLTTSPLD